MKNRGISNNNLRHSIRLKEYDYSERGAYFITTCTRAKAPYFDIYPELKAIAIKEWALIQERFPSEINDAFIIMPNHIHAVIILDPDAGTDSAPTIGNIVGAYKSLCANKWLKYVKQTNLGWIGTIWQRNYY
jgi:putative transposase